MGSASHALLQLLFVYLIYVVFSLEGENKIRKLGEPHSTIRTKSGSLSSIFNSSPESCTAQDPQYVRVGSAAVDHIAGGDRVLL